MSSNTDIKDAPQDSLITYPTDFPLKIMGHNQGGFLEAIVSVIKEHDPSFDGSTVEKNYSANNTYMSLRVTVRATSREQLDNLYRALTSHQMVKVVL